MKLDILHTLNTERAARRAVIVITDVDNGAQRLVKASEARQRSAGRDHRQAFAHGQKRHGRHRARPRVSHRACAVAALGHHRRGAYQPGFGADRADARLRRHHYRPAHGVCLAGAFPDVKVLAEWPDVALPPLNVDRYTAFVACTHDPKIDDPALLHALARDCFYIGALGSRKTHAKRNDRLKAAGVSDADFARIHAPIGLDIGAISPAEIAVSIMGEIVQSLRQKPARASKAEAA